MLSFDRKPAGILGGLENVETPTVPEDYDVGLNINGNKASITQNGLWVFCLEPNNVLRVKKLRSSEGFTFNAKEIYGDNHIRIAFTGPYSGGC